MTLILPEIPIAQNLSVPCYSQEGPMYSSKYQMKYLIKKYEIKRDTNMIKPIKKPIKIPIWIVFLVLPLIEFSVSLSVKPLLCPPDSGELGASMTCPEVA